MDRVDVYMQKLLQVIGNSAFPDTELSGLTDILTVTLFDRWLRESR